MKRKTKCPFKKNGVKRVIVYIGTMAHVTEIR